ncbi:chitobiase/beta-hexosaminidase C-terminal domain-containing protein [Ketobacter sp.]
MYYLQNGTAFKAVLSAKLKFIILILAGTLALVGCKDSVEPSGTTNPPPKDTGNETVATPVINPGSGSFEGSVEVAITSTNTIATIYYTLDGTTPSTGSSVYRNPITLTESATIKAMGVMTGANNSNVATASITVTPVDPEPTPDNNPPTLSAIPNQSVQAGATIAFTAQSADLDGTIPALTISGAPTAAVFTDLGDGSASFEWVTTTSDVGDYTVTVTATDATDPTLKATTTATLNVTSDPVTTVSPPTINPDGGEFTDTVDVALTSSTSGAAIRYTLNGDAPSATSTLYTGPIPLTETTTIKAVAIVGALSSTVTEATFTATPPTDNAQPQINAIDAQSVKVGTLLTFDVVATDADGTAPSLTADTRPQGSDFVDQGNGEATFSWTPSASQIGSHTVEIVAADAVDPALTGSISVTITVTAANTTPPPGGEIDGVSHYFQFNEGDATSFADYIGGSATCTDCPDGVVEGSFGFAERFNGTSHLLTQSYDDRLAWPANANVSVEAWIKIDLSCATPETVVGRIDESGQTQWSLGCSNGKAAFDMTDSAGNTASLNGTTDIADAQWHHIAAVKSGNTVTLYVDNAEEATQTVAFSGDFIGNNAPLTIGGLTNGANFTGTLDEVAVHKVALTLAQVKQHFGDGHIGLRRGLLGCENNVKIMPMGDSITRGTGTSQRHSYRPYLFKDLTDSNYDVNFLGFFDDGLTVPGITYEHRVSAVSTKSAAFVNSNVPKWIDSTQENPERNTAPTPDIILLHIGTNDTDAGGNPVSVEENVSNVQALLNNIDGFEEFIDQEIVVVLAKIVKDITDSASEAKTSNFNNQLEAMALSRTDDRLILVDHEDALDYTTDMDDLQHPNNAGSQKMANVWRAKLSEFLPVCTP